MSNRVAIVTGGSRGIGRAVVERLSRDGLSVVVGYAANEVEAQAAVDAATGPAVAVRADVADETAVAALFDVAEREFGGVDVVVNAAGVMALHPVAELDLDAFDRVHRTNVRGAFAVAREAARRVRAGGAILLFSTTVTRMSPPTYAAYAASKAAVEALTPILAKELAGRDVTVNTVAPGPTATSMFLDGKDQATVDALAARSPMGRLGQPEDIAEVVSLLAGRGRWVNGQTVFVNGGVA